MNRLYEDGTKFGNNLIKYIIKSHLIYNGQPGYIVSEYEEQEDGTIKEVKSFGSPLMSEQKINYFLIKIKTMKIIS